MLRISAILCLSLGLILGSNGRPEITSETIDANGETWYGPIRKCPLDEGDPAIDECVRLIVKDLTPKIGKGIPELNIPPLDPFYMDKFEFTQSLGPSITIRLLARDVRMEGMVDYKNLQFTLDSEAHHHAFVYTAPLIRISTNYKLGGNAFNFPLIGSGPARIELHNVQIVGRMLFGVVERKDGTKVVQLSETVIDDLKVGKMGVNIRGLFNGNPVIHSVVNYIGNNFGSEIIQIIKPQMSKNIGEILTDNVVNPALVNLPHLVEYIL